MTTIIGIKCSNGIVIGSDSQLTISGDSSGKELNFDKIYKIGESILFSGSGFDHVSQSGQNNFAVHQPYFYLPAVEHSTPDVSCWIRPYGSNSEFLFFWRTGISLSMDTRKGPLCISYLGL